MKQEDAHTNLFYSPSEGMLIYEKMCVFPIIFFQIFSETHDFPLNTGLCHVCSNSQKTHSTYFISQENALAEVLKLSNDPGFYLIITYCKACNKYTLNIYNNNWNWQDEQILKNMEDELDNKDEDLNNLFTEIDIPVYRNIISTPDELTRIPSGLFKLYFSEAEQKTLFNYMNKKPVRRQYLYRVRKKISNMEKTMRIKINLS